MHVFIFSISSVILALYDTSFATLECSRSYIFSDTDGAEWCACIAIHIIGPIFYTSKLVLSRDFGSAFPVPVEGSVLQFSEYQKSVEGKVQRYS